MILLPRRWRIGAVRSVMNGLGWLFVAGGLYGSYREACRTEGWGSFIVMWFGIVLISLLAATEDGITVASRTLRVVVGLLMLPLSIVFQALFQDFIRFACPT
jgi:hypothetical protein